MGPENEAKPGTTLSDRMVSVRQGDLEDMESCLMRIQVHMEDICSSDSISNVMAIEAKKEKEDFGSLTSGIINSSGNGRESVPEAIRLLADKQEDVKYLSKYVLSKLREVLPRQKGSNEDVNSNLNLKRSRPLSPLYVPRVPGVYTDILSSKRSESGLNADEKDAAAHPLSAFDLATSNSILPTDMLPLKYIKTADNTKAAFQKPPSTIFMPTPKLGGVTIDGSNDLVNTGFGMISKPIPRGPKSPKKRPSRSRRDRNRSRNKVVDVPEPVMQKLQPGDTSKIPEDGYLWRKYGNKPIKTASYKRGYYKCRHYKEVKCPATKIVQQTNEDPGTFSVCYKGEHTCKQQGGHQLGLVSSGRSDPSHETSSLADQMNGNGRFNDSKDDKEKDFEMDKDELENDFWPSQENSSDSASDDLCAADEIGDDAVDSTRSTGAMTMEPLSPLNFEMPLVTNMQPQAMPNDVADPLTAAALALDDSAVMNSLQLVNSWDSQSCMTTGQDFKGKYQPLDTPPCPQDGDMDENNLMNCYDNQLLKLIGGGMWDQPSDINYWYNDMDLPYNHSDLLLNQMN